METLYIIIISLLFLLAFSDLIVGVSNDAVNFLNSAIGSKAAPLRIILIVAAAGVLVGATFSNGMMEVARKGIFYPSNFVFSEIMVIFLAVMITDVILLDLFNTFGLPTSTTVSIVFELLGAAVGIAILKISSTTKDITELATYINSGKALAIISGILISVVIAFTVGALVMYISRLIFSFNYEKTLKQFGALWGGFAITGITYFILIKGASGASFMSKETYIWISTHTWVIIVGSLAIWTIIMQFLVWAFKINILKLIVLVGTFALAMAFAGNDLVNFIGVPLAGFESFKTYIASGTPADSLAMTALAGKVKTPTLYLLIAGLVMVITLWLSRKARSVVQTSINLSTQTDVNERFESSGIARAIVRQFIHISNTVQHVIPEPFQKKVSKRFDASNSSKDKRNENGIAFDLIRASVNLVVASILIALGTSLKLPLSTTYVTFMVAMGTSLADGAWDRESAVYRITGVITVIGGWFFTALSAFTMCFIVALFIAKTWVWGLFVLGAITLFILYRTHILHRKKSKNTETNSHCTMTLSEDANDIYEVCSNNVSSILIAAAHNYERTIHALKKEDRKTLKELSTEVKQLDDEAKNLKKNVPHIINQLSEDYMESGHYYVEVIDYAREAMHCLSHITGPVYKHVDNNHKPITKLQEQEFDGLTPDIISFLKNTVKGISESNYNNSQLIIETANHILNNITKIRKRQLNAIKKELSSTRTNLLYMDIINETKNCVINVNNLYKAFRDFSDQNNKTQNKKII